MADVTDAMVKAYKKEYARNPVSTRFMTTLLVMMIIFVIAGIVTGGDSITGILFDNPSDTFMDYFNSIVYSSNHPYTVYTVIYPPFVTILYAILGHFTMPFINMEDGEILSIALRDSQMGLMSYFFVTFITFCLLHMIFLKITLNKGVYVRSELLFFLLILSYPSIFAFERGNNILLTVVFCFVFLMGYRSENKIVRYISYISLGCAAGFKFYPVIFGLLVLRERKWMDALVCGTACAFLVLFPFVFTDGNIFVLLETIGKYTGSVAGESWVINISDLLFALLEGYVPKEVLGAMGLMLALTVLLLSAIIVVFDKRMKLWKLIALISCNLVIGPGVGTPYLFIYITLPILYFLISENKMTKENLFFLICFAMILGLFIGFEGISSNVLVVIKTGFVAAITIKLIGQGIRHIYEDRTAKTDISTISN